jgi:hypothetical protein
LVVSSALLGHALAVEHAAGEVGILPGRSATPDDQDIPIVAADILPVDDPAGKDALDLLPGEPADPVARVREKRNPVDPDLVPDQRGRVETDAVCPQLPRPGPPAACAAEVTSTRPSMRLISPPLGDDCRLTRVMPVAFSKCGLIGWKTASSAAPPPPILISSPLAAAARPIRRNRTATSSAYCLCLSMISLCSNDHPKCPVTGGGRKTASLAFMS